MTLGGVRASGDASVSIGGSVQGPVSTTNIGTQVIGMSSVPLAVAAKDPEAVFAAASIDTFIGRKWLTTEVDLFMARNSCGYVFVQAVPVWGRPPLRRGWQRNVTICRDFRPTLAAGQNGGSAKPFGATGKEVRLGRSGYQVGCCRNGLRPSGV